MKFTALSLVFFIFSIVPFTIQAAKDINGVSENGFYILYDNQYRPFITFCDFNSDKGFIWTLIESFSLNNSMKAKYRKGFFQDFPTVSSFIDLQEFRLENSVMKSIAGAPGSTHFRTTCNFNTNDRKGIQNHLDYLRVSFCNFPNFFKNVNKNTCTKVDYINVQGQSCRDCSIPIHDGGNEHHMLANIDRSPDDCDRLKFGGAKGYAFGDYRLLDSKFSCSMASNSTTNWWIGGADMS
ncbi:uncharacterized protein TRIADDRAFT_61683 [Trichoplax adhaerens]|uniref:Fibrinogen C-terminal domain-containing protein n=1 Tax=Trichoplax adhaerens TaxID=10228 RepID=B3SBN9_TRIAD|nr:predicted protein [Trichoplax adhaerens]EDV19896.1 predicted protein [Trichoplax adhaerens]|eukprot:XP_002117638.1 predicted protein [Trichoplax adhaerens]